MKILFFGNLREQLGTGEIELPLATETNNIAELLETLKQRGPEWQQALSAGSLLYAVNQTMATRDTLLEDSDEVALFPPGDRRMITIAVQAADFDAGQEIRQLQADRTDVGGIAIFTGQVRDTGDKPLGFMHLEHYPGMTEASLQQTAEQAAQRWALIDIRIVHRIGDLLPGDQIVFVGVSSIHREAAFNACEFIMDHLKTHAPFWKKEYYRDGSTQWVEAKNTDQQRNARWDQHN